MQNSKTYAREFIVREEGRVGGRKGQRGNVERKRERRRQRKERQEKGGFPNETKLQEYLVSLTPINLKNLYKIDNFLRKYK